MGNTQCSVWVCCDAGDASFDVDFKDTVVSAYIADTLFVQIPDFIHGLPSFLMLLSQNTH